LIGVQEKVEEGLFGSNCLDFHNLNVGHPPRAATVQPIGRSLVPESCRYRQWGHPGL